MREIRTSGATRGEVALRVLPYSTGENSYSVSSASSPKSSGEKKAEAQGLRFLSIKRSD